MVVSDDEDSSFRDSQTLFESASSSILHKEVNATSNLFT
jgi:hypothetical protein